MRHVSFNWVFVGLNFTKPLWIFDHLLHPWILETIFFHNAVLILKYFSSRTWILQQEEKVCLIIINIFIYHFLSEDSEYLIEFSKEIFLLNLNNFFCLSIVVVRRFFIHPQTIGHFFNLLSEKFISGDLLKVTENKSRKGLLGCRKMDQL